MQLILTGILTDALSGAVTLLIGTSSLLGGAAHYAAILTHKSGPETERATALGFFLGFGLGVLSLLIDSTT
ncbi:MAG TPA: hypothetical protein VHE08_07090 [Solirubrobacterales bacterium]|nr:hypothetical protein [Solirubrobacterales bacterium]